MLACPEVLTSGKINLFIAYSVMKKFKNSVFASKVKAPEYSGTPLFWVHKLDLSRRTPLWQYKFD